MRFGGGAWLSRSIRGCLLFFNNYETISITSLCTASYELAHFAFLFEFTYVRLILNYAIHRLRVFLFCADMVRMQNTPALFFVVDDCLFMIVHDLNAEFGSTVLFC